MFAKDKKDLEKLQQSHPNLSDRTEQTGDSPGAPFYSDVNNAGVSFIENKLSYKDVNVLVKNFSCIPGTKRVEV